MRFQEVFDNELNVIVPFTKSDFSSGTVGFVEIEAGKLAYWVIFQTNCLWVNRQYHNTYSGKNWWVKNQLLFMRTLIIKDTTRFNDFFNKTDHLETDNNCWFSINYKFATRNTVKNGFYKYGIYSGRHGRNAIGKQYLRWDCFQLCIKNPLVDKNWAFSGI